MTQKEMRYVTECVLLLRDRLWLTATESRYLAHRFLQIAKDLADHEIY